MKMLLAVVKAIGGVIVAGILFTILVANFGTADSRLECPGDFIHAANDSEWKLMKPATLYAEVQKYRWFIFWADHDAMITWEIQPGRETGFGYYTDNRFGMQITDFQNAKTYGTFMPLSKRISVETYFDGAERFEGVCK